MNVFFSLCIVLRNKKLAISWWPALNSGHQHTIFGHTGIQSSSCINFNFVWFYFIVSRGFAHSSVDALHPLPERPEESLPLSYIETVRSGNFANFTPDTSGRSSPTTDNTPSIANGLSESNTWSTNTGILTGRSSVYSWGNEDVSLIMMCCITKHSSSFRTINM